MRLKRDDGRKDASLLYERDGGTTPAVRRPIFNPLINPF
jgi:hypothetical protein